MHNIQREPIAQLYEDCIEKYIK